MHDRTTHKIKQLGFSGLLAIDSRFSIPFRLRSTKPKNPTVSYCQTVTMHFETTTTKDE